MPRGQALLKTPWMDFTFDLELTLLIACSETFSFCQDFCASLNLLH